MLRIGLLVGGAILGERRFGYTGDSSFSPALAQLAADSEVLVSECSSADEDNPIHMNLRDDIPRLRAAMAPTASLILTHLGRDIDATHLPNTIVARDFETYGFE